MGHPTRTLTEEPQAAMNVLFLTSTFPRYAGDQQAPFVLEQARAWKAARPGDRLFILAPHDAGAARAETVDGIAIRRYRYMPRAAMQTLAYPAILPNIRARPARLAQVPPFLWSQYRAAARIIRDEGIGLVYAHWVMPQGVVARALGRRLGVPYVLQNHSSDLAVFDRFGAPGRRLARAVLRDAAAFFCVNSDQRDHARRVLPGLDAHVLPMGVSLDPAAVAMPARADAARFDIGTISRLSRKKGLTHLIDAAERLAAAGQRLRIGLAGDGEDAAMLKARPRRSNIRFPGFLSGSEKTAFFGDCFAMAFASINAEGDVEGMPVALLEALVCGKPTLASRATNITLLPEWEAIRGDVELLDDPTDHDAFAAAMARLATLPASEAAARRDRLRKAMAGYRWDRLIAAYLRVIDRAISGSDAP